METRPKVLLWYTIYLWILAVMYIVVAGIGLLLFFLPAKELEMEELEKLIVAGVCVGMSVPLAAASLLPLAFHPRPWLWIYGLVMIALGLTSCCFWPICIPLLIFWLKPEVQRHYGRNP